MTKIITKQTPPFYWQFDQDCFNDISSNEFTADFWQQQNAIIGKESGRGTTWFIRHNHHELVLRHYLRGGLMRHLSKDNYFFNGLDKTRAFAEFTVLHQLRKLNLPVPKPAAAQIIKKGLFYRADILSHKIPQAQDLVQILQEAKSSEFYQELGRMISEFHQHGLNHADLNIQNILQDQAGKFWLIDFDRAQFMTPESNWQKANLDRLKRSFEKEKVRHQIKWSQENWLDLLKGYKQS